MEPKKIYKVWIEIEEIDEENDIYQKLDLPFASTGTFNSEAEAFRFAQKMHDENKDF